MPSRFLSSKTMNALATAVKEGNLQAVRAQLDQGADVNARAGSAKTTALHLLALPRSGAPEGGLAIARLLLEAGADVAARTRSNWTPIQVAIAQMSYAETPAQLDFLTKYIRLLWKSGASLTSPPGGDGMFTVGGKNTAAITSLLEELPTTRRAAQRLAALAPVTKFPPEINATILSYLKAPRGKLSPDEQADKLAAFRRMTQSQKKAYEAQQEAETLAAMKTGGRKKTRRRKTTRRRK